jgi:quercetin dioxygenase-like cupin family protein
MIQQLFESELQEQGYSAAVEVTRPADYYLEPHAHPFDAYALVTKGEITIVLGNGQKSNAPTYRVGDVFQLLRGTLHCEYAGPQGVTYLSGRRGGDA